MQGVAVAVDQKTLAAETAQVVRAVVVMEAEMRQATLALLVLLTRVVVVAEQLVAAVAVDGKALAAQAALASSSFAISAHSVAQAERSHHQAVTQFTHLQLQGRIQHEPFCTSYCTGHC
jgi:hypothetical protein